MAFKNIIILVLFVISFNEINAQYTSNYIIKKTKENIETYKNYKIEFTFKFINLKAKDTFQNEISQRILSVNNSAFLGYSLGVINNKLKTITTYNEKNCHQWLGEGYSYTNFNKNFRQTN